MMVNVMMMMMTTDDDARAELLLLLLLMVLMPSLLPFVVDAVDVFLLCSCMCLSLVGTVRPDLHVFCAVTCCYVLCAVGHGPCVFVCGATLDLRRKNSQR